MFELLELRVLDACVGIHLAGPCHSPARPSTKALASLGPVPLWCSLRGLAQRIATSLLRVSPWCLSQRHSSMHGCAHCLREGRWWGVLAWALGAHRAAFACSP